MFLGVDIQHDYNKIIASGLYSVVKTGQATTSPKLPANGYYYRAWPLSESSCLEQRAAWHDIA